jgi:hypothetical protein
MQTTANPTGGLGQARRPPSYAGRVEMAAGAPRRSRLAVGTGTAAALAAIAVITVVVGLIVESVSGTLGAPLAPFFAHLDAHLDAAAILALPFLAICLAAAVRLLRRAGGPVPFLLGATAIGLAARLALAAARDGIDGWYSVFGADPEAANEYLPALPSLHSLGLHAFLDRFAEISRTLPIHPSAHPPGTLVLFDAVGVSGAKGAAALVIGLGALVIPLTYVLARRLDLDEGRSRAAALLVAFSPGAMLYGVVSTDAMFATLGLAAACLLLASGFAARACGALVLAIASFFSWALLAVGAFVTLVAWRRDGPRSAVEVALVAAVGVGGFYALLYAATGFDPIGAIRAAGEAYDLGISNARPYSYWLFGSPVAFAVSLGLPTAWYAARAIGAREAAALALAAVIVVSVVVGLTKAETERIWLFMVPLAAVAAASLVPLRRMPVVLVLLLAQAVAASLLLETIW